MFQNNVVFLHKYKTKNGQNFMLDNKNITNRKIQLFLKTIIEYNF